MSKMHLTFASIVAAALSVGSASAAIVFDFDASDGYVAGNQALRNADGTNFAGGSGRAFSTNDMHPASGYTGPAFFGGFMVDGGSDGFGSVTVANNVDSADPILFSPNGGTNNLAYRAVIMGAVGTVSNPAAKFDSSSSVIVGSDRGSFGGGTLSLVFRSGSDYFISSTSVQTMPTSPGTVTLDSAALDALSFDTYDPATSLTPSGSASTFDPFVNAWDAVGVHVRFNYNATSIRTNVVSSVHDLTVDATLVPEPASMALIGLGGAMLLGRRRRA